MRRTFDPHADPDARGHFGTLVHLLPYLWPRGRLDLKARVIGALALLTAAKIAIVYVPFLYKGAVDALAPAAQGLEGAAIATVPIALILAYGVVRVASQAFGELRDAVFAKVGQHALRSIALIVFRHLHALSMRFHLDRRTGGLSRAIERGTKAIEFLLRFSLFNIIPTLLEISLVCGVLLVNYGFEFASITFVAIAIYITFTVGFTEWRTKFRREMNRTDSIASTRAIDSLLNFETVKYFGNESYEAERFDSAMARYEHAAVRSQVTLALLNIGQGFVIAGAMCAVMWLAGVRVVEGSMTIGDFVLVNTFMMQLYQPLGFLGFVYREVKQSLVDMEKMFELLKIDSEVRDEPRAGPLRLANPAAGARIEFNNVEFRYDPERGILRDVSFSVPAGRSVAVVGRSGAGKSTISRILFRFYDIEAGSVTVDGQDLRDVTQASLRAAIGMVPQDTVLFNDTIRYNIRYGNPDADDAAVEAAAKLAQIHDFITALPDGYDSTVGERGLKLSGGEKQRVAIARSILKDPPILLLDEATSALDSATEQDIQAALQALAQNRTTLIIAHRLSTVVDADEIIVLESGRIVERGRHQDLLDRDGVYAAMWRRQQEAAAARERLRDLDENGEPAPIPLAEPEVAG